MNLTVRPVTTATRYRFAELLTEASAWQRSRGSEGWTYAFDDDWMRPRIERGELFLIELNKETVAAVRLLWEDFQYWDEREFGDSIYLHTFAVARDKAGLGIGSQIIDQIAQIGRGNSRSRMRLDCSLSSVKLIAFYERNGFRSVGTKFLNGKMMNLMEKDISGDAPV